MSEHQINARFADLRDRIGLAPSSPAFTMTEYQQVLPGMESDAAEKFSAEVFGDEASEVGD